MFKKELIYGNLEHFSNIPKFPAETYKVVNIYTEEVEWPVTFIAKLRYKIIP